MFKKRRFKGPLYHTEHSWRTPPAGGLYPRVRTVLLGGCLLTALIVAGGALGYSRLLTIEFVDINAEGGIDEQEARAYVFAQMERARFGFLPQKNILFFSGTSLKEDLAQRFALDAVSVSKRLPHTVRVSVKGKPFRLLFLREGRVLDIASDGSISVDLTEDRWYGQPSVAYARALAASSSPASVPLPPEEMDAPIVMGLSEAPSAETAAFVRALFVEVAARGYHPMYFTLHPDNQTLEMNVREGWRVLFTLLEGVKEQVSNTQIILDTYFKDGRKNLEYIDVRFDNRVFYK